MKSLESTPLRSLVTASLLALLLFFLGGAIAPSPARANISQQEETPGQMLYQSRQTLSDRNGNTWNAIAFHRVGSQDDDGVYLRLVGFPGVANLNHARPMQIRTSLGQTFRVENVSEMTTDNPTPAPNIGQFDLTPVLPQLQVFIPIEMHVATADNAIAKLDVASGIIREWKAIARQN